MRVALLPCVWCVRGHESVMESVATGGLPAGDDSLSPLFFFLIKCMSSWLDWNTHVDPPAWKVCHHVWLFSHSGVPGSNTVTVS